MKKNKKNSSRIAFPNVRLRRLRRTPAVRDLLQETHLSVKDLILPIFVKEGITKPQTVKSMPGVQRLPLEKVTDEVEQAVDLGLGAIILFGIPSTRDNYASSAFDDKGIVQQTIGNIRKQFENKVAIVTDVCLCQYTVQSHCGFFLPSSGKVDNDSSIETLAKVATSHARAGADIVAPSAMMDGQVQAIRTNLDQSGFEDVAIMSYSAKQASPLYMPFRDAAHSSPGFGDRRGYQMPYSNAKEAMREIETDISEGADIILIKPALPYLDLIYQAKRCTNVPVCAYSVSGEYSLVKAAALKGWIDEDDVTAELLVSMKRAGADMIITYQAKKMAAMLKM